MLSRIHHLLADGASGVRSQVLQRGRGPAGGADDGGIFHCPVFFKDFMNGHYAGHLLADSHINTINAFAFLINDSVNSYGGFSGLAVPDNQLPLAPADGNHRVYGLDTGFQRLFYPLAVNNIRGLGFQRTIAIGNNRTLTVYWAA